MTPLTLTLSVLLAVNAGLLLYLVGVDLPRRVERARKDALAHARREGAIIIDFRPFVRGLEQVSRNVNDAFAKAGKQLAADAEAHANSQREA